MPQTVIGCDLARGWIDTHTLPTKVVVRVDNNPDSVARWAASLPANSLVVFEATSGCDTLLIKALCDRGLRFARVNPRQAREFARATGVLGKTDRVDARILADMGRLLPLEVSAPPHPDRARLSDFLRCRRQLVEMRKAEKVRRHSAGQPAILREIETMIALLDRRIVIMDRKIAPLIDDGPEFIEHAELLRAVPGIGPTVLATLLGELPELGTLCRRRIASLAGRAPHARESGTWRGTRRIWGGRRKVREALYIAALSASRRVPLLIAMRDRMKAAGKAPKTVLIAVARQLLVILNAMIRNRQPIRL